MKFSSFCGFSVVGPNDENIFVMNKSGLNRIEKKSKREALAILTQGFATLDEGVLIFDEVARHPITIITEGNNTKYIEKAIELKDRKSVV